MYQPGQQVLYGIHGVCNILSIESMRFDRVRQKYYVLQPQTQTDARYYVPVDNEAAVAKLKPLMTAQELLQLLHSEEVRNAPFPTDEGQRKLLYRELISSGDRARLMGIIGALYRHKRQQQAAGRKFHLSDENFLSDAQKLLNAEFSTVFGLEARDVGDFILRELEESENTH